jgi:hypothetical protein
VFQQTISIPIGTNYALLLVDMLLHVYEADFVPFKGFSSIKIENLTFNSSFRYIDDVLSLKKFSAR